jgi:hypothetical protein
MNRELEGFPRLATLTKTTCPLLVDLLTHRPYLGREYTECKQWRTKILERIRTQRPRSIVITPSFLSSGPPT